MMQNYYQVLEVSPNVPQHELLAAYQRAKETYSPGSPALYTMFTEEEAREIRNLVEEAFLVLGNPAKRKEYDGKLTKKNHQPTSKDLPDFTPTSTKSIRQDRTVSVSPQSYDELVMSASGKVPEGFAKSRLSVYELKPEVEHEISQQKDFNGAFLRKVRQYKNINIDLLSKETRISRSYLNALESDDFEALPAPVFLRGFVIQVAKVLGLNENIVSSSYMSRIKRES
ncbi:MAG: hypothetical protein A2Z20_01965 [Bdellovibrionales bacterium RBG_16_40_8]|nr:MAG: hypothetical protein A2Z20_01965 [Bdellovibrionales bacterium RBG_16_40_8]